MNRENFEKYILDEYGVTSDYPWEDDFVSAVFRHKENKKWFALAMKVSKRKFGFDDDSLVDVVNLKCESLLIGSLTINDGIFPAYHMNKRYWISMFLDGTVPDETIKYLTNMSFELTK